MKKFKVCVEGSNFLLPLDNDFEIVGFFSTFIISCQNYYQLRDALRKDVLERVDKNKLDLIGNSILGSYVIISSIYIEDDGETFDQAAGFSFYHMSYSMRVVSLIKRIFYRVFSPKKLLSIKLISWVG